MRARQRIGTLALIALAVALVAVVLFRGAGGAYEVEARFLNAAQLVPGNKVQSGGVGIGSVKEIDLAPNGQAIVSFEVDPQHSPLPAGTRASIRQSSLSGIANRFVDLTFPAHREGVEEIPDGGRIPADLTTTQVDLDQVFNTLDPTTRRGLTSTLKRGAASVRGRGDEIRRGLRYLNPSLATTRRLFEEATRDTPVLERTIVDSQRLVSTLSERHDELASLIGRLSVTTRAIGGRKGALAESLELLPPTLRRANTSLVNVRLALGDVDPLVNATKPVLPRARPVLAETRRLVADARPALRNLRAALSRPGRGNDLNELVDAMPPLAEIAVVEKQRTVSPGGRRVSVGTTEGAFGQAARAMKAATPVIAFARPHTADFLGWLDDFSTTGGFFDALGGTTRVYISFAENITGGPPKQKQFHRCPGGADVVAPDGSNLLTPAERERLNCREEDRAAR